MVVFAAFFSSTDLVFLAESHHKETVKQCWKTEGAAEFKMCSIMNLQTNTEEILFADETPT